MRREEKESQGQLQNEKDKRHMWCIETFETRSTCKGYISRILKEDGKVGHRERGGERGEREIERERERDRQTDRHRCTLCRESEKCKTAEERSIGITVQVGGVFACCPMLLRRDSDTCSMTNPVGCPRVGVSRRRGIQT